MSSFRVICIDDKPRFGKSELPFVIKQGETYEVIEEFISHRRPDWGVWYILSIQPDAGYPPEHFIRLSDRDETEFIRNTKQEPSLFERLGEILKPVKV